MGLASIIYIIEMFPLENIANTSTKKVKRVETLDRYAYSL